MTEQLNETNLGYLGAPDLDGVAGLLHLPHALLQHTNLEKEFASTFILTWVVELWPSHFTW